MERLEEGWQRGHPVSRFSGGRDPGRADAASLDVAPVAVGGPAARVALGVRDQGFQDEVLDCLHRDPRIEVVAASGEPNRLLGMAADRGASTFVTCPVVAAELKHPSARSRIPTLVLVAQEMTVPVLRDAIDVGARAIVSWPEERQELCDLIARAPAPSVDQGGDRGTVIAVVGAKGGAGATFLATHLGAAFARRGNRVALVDLDTMFADLTVALGVDLSEATHSIADLGPVMNELSTDHVDRALFSHPAGFDALLASVDGREPVPGGLIQACVVRLAASREIVILNVPRRFDEDVRLAVDMADRVLLLMTMDLFGLFAARRTMSCLALGPERCRVVASRWLGQGIQAADVERVLGLRPWASIRFDSGVRRVQGRGQLLHPRSRRAARDVARIAQLVAEETTRGAGEASGRSER